MVCCQRIVQICKTRPRFRCWKFPCPRPCSMSRIRRVTCQGNRIWRGCFTKRLGRPCIGRGRLPGNGNRHQVAAGTISVVHSIREGIDPGIEAGNCRFVRGGVSRSYCRDTRAAHIGPCPNAADITGEFNTGCIAKHLVRSGIGTCVHNDMHIAVCVRAIGSACNGPPRNISAGDKT